MFPFSDFPPRNSNDFTEFLQGLFVQSFRLNVLFEINPLIDENRASYVNLLNFFVKVADRKMGQSSVD